MWHRQLTQHAVILCNKKNRSLKLDRHEAARERGLHERLHHCHTVLLLDDDSAGFAAILDSDNTASIYKLPNSLLRIVQDIAAMDEIDALGGSLPGVMTLTYYEPTKVFGDTEKSSCLYFVATVRERTPVLHMWIGENNPSPTKDRHAIIDMSKCKNLGWSISDLKVSKLELSADGKEWASKYGLDLVKMGISGKGLDRKTWKQHTKYRMLVIDLFGIRMSDIVWRGDKHDDMNKASKELEYFFTSGNVTRNARFLILFDVSLYLPHLSTFTHLCSVVGKEKQRAALKNVTPAPTPIPATPTVIPPVSIPKLAAPGPTIKSRAPQLVRAASEASGGALVLRTPTNTGPDVRTQAALTIQEKLATLRDILCKHNLSPDHSDFDTKTNELIEKMVLHALDITYYLGQRKLPS